MKEGLRKYWFPLAVVILATVQSLAFGGPRGLRADSSPSPKADTVIYTVDIYTKFRSEKLVTESDTTGLGAAGADTSAQPLLSARDTIFPPDSLRETDPFRYKYYVALMDSLTHVQVRDSLRAAGDSLDWPRLDSLYFADSTLAAKLRFEQWYNSLDKMARKRYDFEQKTRRKQHIADSVLNVKDSLRAIRDSIRENTPRILETYVLPDSLFYKRIVSWTRDPLFNDVSVRQIDTSYNYWFHDSPIRRKDIGATYLGTEGSPARLYDFFKRNSVDGVSFYEPLEIWGYSPSTLPMYNTKTPYTELAYWGNLFSNTEREESDLHILTTQNIYPSLNFSLGYDRRGSNGMLQHEDVDNRTFHAAVNYIGRRYAAHGGYIFNKMSKSENGGLQDSFWIRDTLVGSREIDVRLKDADNLVKKNTLFLDQTYRIPFTFLQDFAHRRDSGYVRSRDSLITDVTTAFIGHSSEFTTLRKVYTDNIALSDSVGRSVYWNNFYLNPTRSMDSLRVMKLENKVFIKLQPWSRDAVVSSLDVGLGNRILNYYMFRPEGYLSGGNNTIWNSSYLYGGTGGRWRRNVSWDARGYMTFIGEEAGDFGISANASYSIYPFRRARKSPVTLAARFETSLDEPEYYEQHYFSNHYRWENDFGKKSTTKIEGSLDVPYYKLRLEGAYSLLDKNIWYDSTGVVRQNTTPMSVAKVALRKDFAVGNFLHLENSALFQVSSNEEVLPLPKLALNLRWYFQFNVVKDVMQMQLGADGTMTSKWYAPAYSPATGQFYNQRREQYGECPYFDVFANIQWKRACIFVKVSNAGLGWPMDKADYFSAAGYIRPERQFKFGVFWPFYTQPRRNQSVSGRASNLGGGNSGGGRSSGGLGGGLRSLAR